MLAGPVSAATSQGVTVAQASLSGTIAGHVTTDTGSGLSAASVLVDGSGQHQTATTDASGNFTISLPAGLYTVTVVHGGYQTGSSDVTVAAGQSVSLEIGLTTASLNSLNVIGRTSASGGGGNATKFNISSTTQQTLSQTQILARNTPELTSVINELPGVTIPHATTNPNQSFVIRGLRFETKVTLDGHPVSSGTGGTFLTNYAAAPIFGSIDVVKGTGLNGPIAGESGAGTVNLRTPDFAKNGAYLQTGLDSYGGTLYTAIVDLNFLKDDKLSFVLGRTFSGYRGPTYGTQEPNYSGAAIPTNHTYTPPQNLTNGIISYITDFSDTYSLNAELAKMRYKFSDATSLSLEFLGLQGRFDPQGGAYGQFAGYGTIPQCLNANVAGNGAQCTVTSTYGTPASASLIGQTGVPLYAFFPGSDVRQNQPNFNADFKTTFKNDTILFRPYTAAINRLIDGTQENNVPGDGGAWSEVTNPAFCQVTFVAATVANGGAKGPCFAAGVAPVAAYVNDPSTPHTYATTTTPLLCSITTPCFTTVTATNNAGQQGYGAPFTTLELDKLFGYTFSYIHPVGANTYNLSFDHYFDDATALTNDASPLSPGCSFVVQSGQVNPVAPTAGNPNQVGLQPNCHLPGNALRPSDLSVPETFTSVSSLAATAQFQLTSKLEFDFGGYFTHYLINAQQLSQSSLAPYKAAGVTGLAPVVLEGVQNSASHFDPHFGLLFRPTRDLAFRFSGGSSITIPYASLVSGFATYAQGSASTTVSSPNAQLLPEELVSLDGGLDYRTPDGTVVSADLYNTVIHNPWVFTKVQICNSNITCAVALAGLEPTNAGFTSQTLNGAEQYAQGFEISISKLPAIGFGYRVNTSFERNYYLHMPASFFSSPQSFFNGSQFASTGSGSTSVPYSKAYAEIQYASANKGLLRFGADYEGPNNSYNAPAFWIFDAGARINTGWHDVLLGATVENLFNTNFNALLARGVEFQGVQAVAATAAPNGYSYSFAPSTGLVSPGPITFRFTLTKQF
jgi:hypothetical protein